MQRYEFYRRIVKGDCKNEYICSIKTYHIPMKRLYVLTIFLAFGFHLIGNPIDENTAQQLAQSFWKENNITGIVNGKVLKKRMEPARFVNVAPRFGYSEFYIFSNEDGKGFVVLSADDCVTPVLAYSYDNNFVSGILPPNLKGWLDGCAEQIQQAVSLGIIATEDVRNEWECLREGKNLPLRSERQIYPLIASRWDIGTYYNAQCPTHDVYGQTQTGCIATAMAQIMRYWSYPAQGNGSHSYTPSRYPELGLQYANFGDTEYQWSLMPDTLTEDNLAVATLMYHCGVSVDMDYGIGGDVDSGSLSFLLDLGLDRPCAENALKTYFDYKTALHGLEKNDYSNTQWINLLKSELNEARPVLYSGVSSSGGHAFICDGYNNSDYFHFNWGRGGDGDCYCNINNLIPEGHLYSFSSGQQAIMGIEPNNPTYNFHLEYYSTPQMSQDEYVFFDDIAVYAEVINTGVGAFMGYIAASAYSEDASGDYYYLDILGQWDLTNTPMPKYYYRYGTLTHAGGPPFIPGNYMIVMLYSMDGNSWNVVENQYFDDAYFDIVYAQDIETNSDFNITTGDNLYCDTDANINVDIRNAGASTFYGKFRIDLANADGSWVQTIDTYECTSGLQPNSHFADGIDFSGSITASPGTYLLELLYQASGSSDWHYAGASNYPNPIWVNVTFESTDPDPFEPNNSVNTAYPLVANFSEDTASVNTTDSNFHEASDLDYYKIALDSGYDYILSARLHDALNSGDGNAYTADARFAYSTDGVNWSDFYDDVMSGSISIEDGGTVYFYVIHGSGSDTGTYLLSLDIARAQHMATFIINTSVVPADGGSVDGGGTYDQGETCTLNATPNVGFTFQQWTKNDIQVSTNPSYSFTVTESATYVAHFMTQSYTITAVALPADGGTVTGGGSYTYGQTCTISAESNNGYVFTSWTENGNVVSTDADYVFSVTGNRNFVANFAVRTYVITATAGDNGSISPSGEIVVEEGADLTFTITPNYGYAIHEVLVDDALVGETTSYTFSDIASDHTIFASFTLIDGLEEDEASIRIYPNPTAGIVNLTCPNTNEVRIYNMLGVMVKRVDVEARCSIQIDMTHLPDGVYILQAMGDHAILRRQIVKSE